MHIRRLLLGLQALQKSHDRDGRLPVHRPLREKTISMAPIQHKGVDTLHSTEVSPQLREDRTSQSPLCLPATATAATAAAAAAATRARAVSRQCQ